MAKILVVDDEPGYLELLDLILKADGHDVETAETAEDAVEIGHRSCPDVLLADWKLKGILSGLDVARALHAEGNRHATIMMTGYSITEMRSGASDIHDLHVLQKPFGADAVRDIVRRAIEQRKTT